MASTSSRASIRARLPVGRPDSYTAAAGAVKLSNRAAVLADVGVAQHPSLRASRCRSADQEATTMTTITIPTLSTQRLILRGFTAADLDALAPIYADPQVSRYIGDGTPADRAATLWALIEQATGRLIGRAGLYNPEGWPGLEAGWLLARDRWGCGFATEAGHAILAYAFTQLSADHVISLIHPANTASIRVAQRLGERLEREMVLKGQRALVYGINRQRWQQGQQGQQGQQEQQEQTRSI